MMVLPWLLCGALCVLALVLWVKLRLLQKSLDEISAEFAQRLSQDTNTLICLSSGDRHARRLAAELNVQLRLLRRQRRQYLNGDRALKQAVTNIAHDLRTPLTALSGYLELLQREQLSADAARYLALIENRAQALRQMTEELFRYTLVTSAPEQMHPEPVDLNALLEQSVAACYGAFKARGITPAITMPQARVVRPLDPAAAARVLDNVLHNALKYSAGDLDITLREDGEVCFANSAPGLDEVQVGRLFDRFFTVEAAQNATGLGLAIAKTLVEQMGGRVSAQYDAGRLCIRILFPEKAL